MTPVTRAVLLAAGRGSRLGGLTENFPKPMLEVGGRPILHRIVEGLTDAGIEAITIVTGHCAEELERATGDGSQFGVRINYIRQETPDGTARALSFARPGLLEAPFFVGWGDIVVETANYVRVVESAEATGAALAVNEVDDPHMGGAVYFGADQIITRLVEKPPEGTSNTRWNNAGLFVLPRAIWPFIDALERSLRGEYELPQAIAEFVEAGNRMTAVPISGPWFDIGTPENLTAARRHFGG